MKKLCMILVFLLVLSLGVSAFAVYAATSVSAQSFESVSIISIGSSGATSISLRWYDRSYTYQHAGYKIYRAEAENGNYTLVKKTDVYASTYTDENLTTGKTYYYKICKYDTSNKNGNFSSVQSATPMPSLMFFSAVSVKKNTVTLTWNEAEEGVDGYVIYRSDSENGPYKAVKRITKRATTSYTDTKAKHGQFYYYKMKPFVTVNGKSVYGTVSYPVRNKVDISLCQPFFTAVGPLSSDDNEFLPLLRLKYGDIILTGGEDYYIGSSSWRYSGDALISYTFKARGVGDNLTGSCQFSVSPIDKKSQLNTVSVTNSGIKLTWKKEVGAIGYKIYRKTGSGSYSAVKTITDYNTVSWTDKTATKINTKYTYYIKAYTKDGGTYRFAEKSDAKSVKRISTPKIKSISNKKDGVVVKWNAVSGAKSYDILRKTGNGSWKYISNTTNTEYIDKNTTVGNTYTYTVCCSDGKNERRVSYYNPNGSKIKRLVAPEGKSDSSSSITLSWNKATKADGYAVYRSTSANGTFKKVKSISDESTVSFTDKKLTFGKYYYYKVRPYTVKNGKTVYGDYGTSVKIRPTMATVTLKKVKATSPTQVQLTWEKISQADGYHIYQASTKYGTYKRVKTITSNSTTSYTVSKLKNTNTYYFKIRGYRKIKGTTYNGDYSVIKSCHIDMLGYAGEGYLSKTNRIWGTDYFKGYPSSSVAKKNMTTIKIKTWDIDSNGKKYTRYHTLTVNKNIAYTVKAIFNEIYNGKEKFPIKSVGGYSWRADYSAYSEHGAGLAIDINPNENA